MAEKFNLIGKDASDGMLSEWAREFLESNQEEGLKLYENELSKTETERKMVLLCNELIDKELEDLGISRDTGRQIEMDRVHFLSKAEYVKNLDGNSRASYSQRKNTMVVIHDEQDTANIFSSVVHEALHARSWQTWHFDESEGPLPYRIGYKLDDPRNDSEKLRGLNEAVTERMVWEILSKHRDRVASELNIPEETLDESYLSYGLEMDVLETVMHEIAWVEDKAFKDVWKAFKQGYFKGDMMHLRSIERAYGPYALEILSMLASRSGKSLTDEEILTFFQTTDPNIREGIREKLINAKAAH